MPKLADLFRARYLADGVDFDSIRVHHTDTAGPAADLACRTLGARAFTSGADIYFAAGQFRPGTRSGLWLLAHEVAHVVQQSLGLVRARRPGDDGPRRRPRPQPLPLTVAAAGTAEERAADAAASALLAGRSTTFSGSVRGAGTDRLPVLQRYMAWEHSMLGDLDPVQVGAAADGEAAPVADYRDLLAELGRAPRRAGAERLRAAHPGLDLVRLRGSGLVVTLGELNVLPDYLGRPEDIESAPLTFIGPLIQSVRSWSVAELARPAGVAGSRGPVPVTLPRLLPGSLRYPLLGPLAETAEIAAVSKLGRRHGFAPEKRYSAVLARNSGHFAPFSWYRWRAFHLAARELIARSATETGAERAALRLRARTWAGYADHFLQDSFAAGHLVNKTLVIQWYIEWLAASGVSYPGRDVLDTLTVARQPLLHGPRLYDRAAARAGGVADTRPGAVAGPPGPTRDAQDVADAGTLGGADRGQRRGRRFRRRAARGLRGVPGDARQRNRPAGGEGRARVPQCALARGLGRAPRPGLPAQRGPHPAGRPGRGAAGGGGGGGLPPGDRGTAAGRRDLNRQLGHLRPLPRPRRAGRPTGLAPALAPGGTAGPVPRAVRAAHDASAAQPHVRRLRTACAAHRRRVTCIDRAPQERFRGVWLPRAPGGPVAYASDRRRGLSPTPSASSIGVAGVADRWGSRSLASPKVAFGSAA